MFWIDKLTGQKYYNKIQALKSSTELEFCIREDYDSYDWITEPDGSWQDIIVSYANQLRQEYNYIRLFYSGGADSHAILNVFLKNNIHLNEILMWRQSPVNYFIGPSNNEINDIAIPFIDSIKEHIPNTKITICDIGSREYENFYSRGNIVTQCYSNLLRPAWSTNLHTLVIGINDIPGICNIDGCEKPTINIDDDGIFWQFADNTFLGHIVSEEILVDSHCNHFFLEPKLFSKQCHIIKNEYLKTQNTDLLNRKNLAAIDKLVRASHLPHKDFISKSSKDIHSEFTFGSEKSRLLYQEIMEIEPDNVHLKLYKKYLTEVDVPAEQYTVKDFFVGTLSRCTRDDSNKFYLHLFA